MHEVAVDVISGRDIKTIEGCSLVNFESADYGSFREINKNHLAMGKLAARAVTLTRFAADRKQLIT